jgi:hypothetical protein
MSQAMLAPSTASSPSGAFHSHQQNLKIMSTISNIKSDSKILPTWTMLLGYRTLLSITLLLLKHSISALVSNCPAINVSPFLPNIAKSISADLLPLIHNVNASPVKPNLLHRSTLIRYRLPQVHNSLAIAIGWHRSCTPPLHLRS